MFLNGSGHIQEKRVIDIGIGKLKLLNMLVLFKYLKRDKRQKTIAMDLKIPKMSLF